MAHGSRRRGHISGRWAGLVLWSVVAQGCDHPWTAEVGASRSMQGTVERPGSSACGGARTPISVVQGLAEVSPFAGREVAIEGVVTADYQDTLAGFYVQETLGDKDAVTSEGLFVYTGARALPLRVGDAVRLRGRVREFEGRTELTHVASFAVCGEGQSVAATELTLPLPPGARLESLEGMLVHLAQRLTVTEAYDLARFGELSLSAEGRLFHPGHSPFDREEDLHVVGALNAQRRVLLDDAREGQYLEPIAHLTGTGKVRLGDEIEGLTAVLSYGFGSYRLQPVDDVVVRFRAGRPSAPANVGGEVRVASFNVLNYFVTRGERGADTRQELDRQAAKLVAALVAMDADVVALSELENGSAAVRDLVSHLNARLGEETYAPLDPGVLGDDAIRVGMLYKPAVVQPLGEALGISFDGLGAAAGLLADRPSLAQRFRLGDQDFTVVANHFKSKGCAGASRDNAARGQGCWNARRTAQALAVLDALERIARETGDDDVLVLGDLNAYGFEDPVLVLEAGGLVHLDKTHLEPEDRYTYVFRGEAGALDHALATGSLASRVTGVDIWHINADEPRHLDYNTEFNPRSAYEADPYRCSDHDPILLGLAFPP